MSLRPPASGSSSLVLSQGDLPDFSSQQPGTPSEGGAKGSVSLPQGIAGHIRHAASLTRHPAFRPCAWNFLSYSVWTLFNKRIFSEFGSLPLLCTGLQMAVVTASVYALLYLRGAPWERASSSVLWGQLVSLSAVRSCDLGLANAALCSMSVAGQQILKATIPVWVCVLSIVYLNRRVEAHVWGIVAAIVIGTAMATVGDPSMRGTPFGVAAMLVSCLCRAGKCVINSRLLQGLPGTAAQEQKLSKLSLLRYEAPMSGACIMVASVVFEILGPALLGGGGGEGGVGSGGAWTLWSAVGFVIATLVNGVLMFANQVTYLGVVEHTSPVASQALMNIKMIFLILLSACFYPLHLSALNAAGMGIAAAGALLYSVVGEAPPHLEKKTYRV